MFTDTAGQCAEGHHAAVTWVQSVWAFCELFTRWMRWIHPKDFGNVPSAVAGPTSAGSCLNNGAHAFQMRGGHELQPEQTIRGTLTSIVSVIDVSGSGKYCFCEAILV